MAARILDGASVAAALNASVLPEIRRFTAAAGRPPGLGIVLVGEDAASEIYVRSKAKAGGESGCGSISSACPRRPRSTSSSALVDRLNASAEHDGILVQSPLPAAMGRDAAQRVFDAIDPAKDVDGFNPVNVGRLVQGRAASRAVHAVRRHRDARSLRHCDRRRARRRHRPQRHRRQADGAAAAAPGRDGDDLSLEDAGARRGRCRSRHPGRGHRPRRVRDARVRQAGRDGHRRRHQPGDRARTAATLLGEARHGWPSSIGGAR